MKSDPEDFDLILNKRLRYSDETELDQAKRYVEWAKKDLAEAEYRRDREQEKVDEKRRSLATMRKLHREVKEAHKRLAQLEGQ